MGKFLEIIITGSQFISLRHTDTPPPTALGVTQEAQVPMTLVSNRTKVICDVEEKWNRLWGQK